MPNRLNNDFILKNSGYSNYEDTVDLPRHRWYYYKEGFSPKLVDRAIEEVGLKESDVIVDPFNGSGTTTLSASVKGIKSYGIEVNPFTSFLSSVKLKSCNAKEIEDWADKILGSSNKTAKSDLLGFSTFSKSINKEKWLFNDSVLNAFEGGWQRANDISSHNLKKIFRLGLIMSAMNNCNATRDGKCLRYRESWKIRELSKETFLNSFVDNISLIKTDIEALPIPRKAIILNGDARQILQKDLIREDFKLCITSPPYLNTFDYSDIYRPELFLGKFVGTNQQLYDLRMKTVRSHVQAKWEKPINNDFGMIYEQSYRHIIEHKDQLYHKDIPLMVQAYFEDMFNVLSLLKLKAKRDAELWLIVSNSAYANKEVPVDLIIGDLGTKAGWYLKEIGVLRHINRRKTKHSPDVLHLRESVIIFKAKK